MVPDLNEVFLRVGFNHEEVYRVVLEVLLAHVVLIFSIAEVRKNVSNANDWGRWGVIFRP
jgi:hypothetical protein